MSEPTRLPNEAPDGGVLDTPSLARRVFRPSNILSFLLALIILYLVYRQLLGFDWREVWVSVQEASLGLFALAFAIFYFSFFFRTLRWEVMLSNVGYSHAVEHPMPSVADANRALGATQTRRSGVPTVA